jgi:hypothetical protein
MQLFPSANSVFNPSRFAAESGQTPAQTPGSSVMGPGPLQGLTGAYLPLLVAVVLLWWLEKRRIKAALK